MNQTYWVFEYIKVLLVYGFMLYIWPSVVFRPHLAGKGRTYRFCFCVNSSIILINTAVLLLGLMHILNQVLVTVLYLGVFLVQLFRNYGLGFAWVEDIRSAYSGTMTVRRMLLKWHTANSKRLKSAASAWWQSTKGSRLEYAVLCVIVLFGMAYFSINALQVHSYGFGDQYVHHAWIYGLTQGKAFSAGIYPEGMHTFIYLMNAVFHLSIYSCNLFLAGIHIQVYIVSAYLLSKALFGWRMSGLFALVGFLTVEQVVVNGIFGVSRLAWTLPQEFALYTVFMSAYGLIRFLRANSTRDGENAASRISFWKSCLRDKNLFIFFSAVAASICIHFYATIIAAFVCMVIVCLNLRYFFRRLAFVRLIAGALAALVITAFPMAMARIAGYKLQGSLDWAMSTISESSLALAEATEEQEANSEEEPRLTLSEKTDRVLRGTYFELYGKKRGRLLAWTDAAVAALAVVLLVFALIADSKRKEGKKRVFTRAVLKSYLIIAAAVFVLMMAYRPRLIGLPALISGTRVCSTIDIFSMLLFASVLDIVFTLVHTVVHERYLKPVSALVCLGIYLIAQAAGIFHGYLYYELTRYPAAVELTREITEMLPEFKYTIISTTDELYQVRETGYHEEWIDMVEKSADRTYTIPTPYLFFFIEKHPILYSQYCFASGPKWLAMEKYARFFGPSGSQYPEIKYGQISAEAAQSAIDYGRKRSYTQTELSNRVIIESKAYAWYQKFSALHPNDGEVIYEDDDILCYCIRQNEFSLFSLGVMD